MVVVHIGYVLCGSVSDARVNVCMCNLHSTHSGTCCVRAVLWTQELLALACCTHQSSRSVVGWCAVHSIEWPCWGRVTCVFNDVFR